MDGHLVALLHIRVVNKDLNRILRHAHEVGFVIHVTQSLRYI